MNTNWEQQLINIENLANIGYWEWHPDKNIFYSSPGFQTMASFLKTDFNVVGLAHYFRRNKQYKECSEIIQYLRFLKKGVSIPHKTIAIKLSRKKVSYFEITVKLNHDTFKNEFHYIGAIQDITEKVQYATLKEKEIFFEKKLAEIASRFINDAHFNDDVLLTLSEIGTMLQAAQVKVLKIENNISSELFSWQNQTVPIAAENVFESLPPNEIKYFIELIKDKKLVYFNQISDLPECVIKTKEYLLKNGSASVIIASIYIDNLTVGALMLTKFGNLNKWDFADIHVAKMTSLILSNAIKQNQIQKKLKNSENRLQFALLAGNLGTWEFNLSENRFYFDEKYANIFGYSNNTLNKLNNWIQANLHPADQLLYNESIVNCINGSKKFYSNEMRIKCKDGSYKWISDWGIVTKFNEHGCANKMVGIIQDISKRKLIEEELILAKNNAENSERLKTAFLANVSHEIRTPMNGITGFAELLYNNSVAEAEKHQYLEIIWKNSTRLLELINNILDISRLESGQIQIFERENDLNQLMEELQQQYNKVNLNGSAVKIVFKKSFCDHSSFIKTDASRLKQVLKNLIDNALKFTPKGFVEIEYYLNDSADLEFCVKDTGKGIEEKQYDLIFKHFSQSEQAYELNKGGTGLGLPITKGLIGLMGGNIWFHSSKSLGSSFYFTIPYKPTRITVQNLD